MSTPRVPTTYQVAWGLLSLLFCISLLDVLLGNTIDPLGAVPTELSFNILSAFWFGEAVSLILLTVGLLIYLRRQSWRFLPIMGAGVASLFICVQLVSTDYVNSSYEWSHKNPATMAYRTLRSTIPYQFNTEADGDPLLNSPFPVFLRAQIPFATGFIMGTVLWWIVQKTVRQRK